MNGAEFYIRSSRACATFARVLQAAVNGRESLSASVLLIAGERLARYGFGDGHPFGPDRHAAFFAEFDARGLDKRVRIMETRAATREELQSFHTPAVPRSGRESVAAPARAISTRATRRRGAVFTKRRPTWSARTLLAAEQIMAGKARRAFVPIAGLHHAARGTAAGFCVFNDCGVAVEMLRRNHGLKRIAYVDIDAHHGDGVYYGFESDPDLIFADIHEDGRHLYPGTGGDEEIGPRRGGRHQAQHSGAARRGRCGFRRRSGRACWRICASTSPSSSCCRPARTASRATPSRTCDSRAETHARAARDLAALAEELGHGRVLGTGGGGYNRINLAQAWSGVVQGFVDTPVPGRSASKHN